MVLHLKFKPVLQSVLSGFQTASREPSHPFTEAATVNNMHPYTAQYNLSFQGLDRAFTNNYSETATIRSLMMMMIKSFSMMIIYSRQCSEQMAKQG